MIERLEKARWHRAKSCANGTCVEVAKIGDHYLVRDSKAPDRGALEFTAEEWVAFVRGVKEGDFSF
jgi:hypothetical protein